MNRRESASALSLLAVACVVAGLLAEAVLRVYASQADTELAERLRADLYTALVEPHGEAGYRPRPGRVVSYNNTTLANINAMGFRGPTVLVPKPNGVFRIVLLGGSTTFGWGVNDDQTVDAYMREILSQSHPDRRIDVINLAFDGYDSYQLLERFRSDGVPLEPNVVIVNAGINDVRNARFADIADADPRTLLYLETLEQLRLEQTRGHPTMWTRTKHWFYLARLPGWLRRQRTLAGQSTGANGGAPTAFYWDALDYFQRNVQRLATLVTNSGGAAILSTPPSSLLTLYEPNHPPRATYWLRDARTTQVYRDSLSARLRSIVAEEEGGGRAVAYAPHDPFAPSLFLDDAHLTPQGNRRLAADFVSALAPWLTASAPEIATR